MALYFFLRNKPNKWILGTDDKFSAWNVMKDNALRFNTKQEADAKCIALNLTADEVEVIKNDIPDKPKNPWLKDGYV